METRRKRGVGRVGTGFSGTGGDTGDTGKERGASENGRGDGSEREWACEGDDVGGDDREEKDMEVGEA